MASIKSNSQDLRYRYFACEESIDSGGESDDDTGCSHFYRQTAKVRFTRTTSKVQHHLEATAGSDGRQQLFGCLRRSSSISQMSQSLERSHAIKNEKIATGGRRSPESEKRQQELERIRQEIKRLDQLQLEQQQREERYLFKDTSPSKRTSPTLFETPHMCQSNALPDSWIGQLPSTSEPIVDDGASSDSSSSNPFCCWDWCMDDDSSWPPHVDLEPFTGVPSQWPFFIQRFKTWIHDVMPNDTLRMIYLEELLSPDLRQKYSSYLSYPGRYRSLLVQLRNHYGHPLVVVRSCFEALRQLTPLDSGNPKSSISDFSANVQNIVATMKVVGCEAELRTFSALELSGLVCKLPEGLHDKWSLYIKEKQALASLPNLGEFATWLQERVVETTWWR